MYKFMNNCEWISDLNFGEMIQHVEWEYHWFRAGLPIKASCAVKKSITVMVGQRYIHLERLLYRTTLRTSCATGLHSFRVTICKEFIKIITLLFDQTKFILGANLFLP